MKIVNQNNVFLSMENALNHSAMKLDGRNEQDLMCFLTNFASIINLYDHSNKVNGNWEPILLKDPIFLLAFISRTKHEQWLDLYLKRCQKLKDLITNDGLSTCIESVPDALGQLLHQVIEIFKQIERWTYYMDKSYHSYSLEDFIKREIKQELSTFFWALVAMRNHLIKEEQITSFQTLEFKKYSYFSSKIWQEGKNKGPFWDILEPTISKDPNGNKPISLVNDSLQILNAISKVGDVLFPFLKQVIDYANSEFDTLKTQKSNFPDTTLIRAFLSLFKIHQDQLNTISKKHLKFYYDAILKQQIKQAIPDKALLYLELSKDVKSYQLAKGTEFNAGIHTSSKPIVFKSLKSVALDSTKITDVYTLAKTTYDIIETNYKTKKTKTNTTSVLNLKQIKNASEIKRDESNDILGWETFGDNSKIPLNSTKMGFAFASPMLCLREGTRHVTMTLTFDEDVKINRFNTSDFFFSTQKGWYQTTPSTKRQSKIKSKNQTILSFILDSKAPAIEAFKKNPDDLDTDWPMFKVVFNQFKGGLDSSPIVKELIIDVQVSDVKTFQLSNTNGPVNTKKPFPLFGVAPTYESSLYMGNSEIFSKPITSLDLNIVWNNLPVSRDFETYYDKYNAYIQGEYDSVTVDHTKVEKDTKKKSLLGRLCDKLNNTNDPKITQNPFETLIPPIVFGNESFMVDFMKLQNGNWSGFEILLDQEDNLAESEIAMHSPKIGTYLFSIVRSTTSCCDGKLELPEHMNKLSYCSHFSYTHTEVNSEDSLDTDPLLDLCELCDPSIQNRPLKYESESNSGFIKMSLVNPTEGFGSAIYPQVVSAIAMVNAAQITNKNNGKVSLIKSPNAPFIPTVKSFNATYSASQTYVLDGRKGCYPIQWFCYTPFANYKTYDNSLETSSFVKHINASLNHQAENNSGITLWPILKSKGTLFLGLQNSIKPKVLNLYFELAQDYTNPSGIGSNDTIYSYMSSSGWKTFDVKSDGTNTFNCSGIITIELPEDISNSSTTMPNGTYWLSISASKDPKTYAKTLLLATNGIEVERSNTSYLIDSSVPRIVGNTIKRPLIVTPQIAAVKQAFPSFGGKAAETTETANTRISTRLKTKDRVVTSGDIYGIVKQAFSSVFYSKSILNKLENTIDTYVLESYSNQTDVNAFTPQISSCSTQEILNYLQKRGSSFSTFRVSNFDMMPICVSAEITLREGSNILDVEHNINDGIRVFLSPWIESNQDQMAIDSPVRKAQITKFIKSFVDVLTIDSIAIKCAVNCRSTVDLLTTDSLVIKHTAIREFSSEDELEVNTQIIYPPNKSTLLISAKKHNITCKLTK